MSWRDRVSTGTSKSRRSAATADLKLPRGIFDKCIANRHTMR